MWMVFCVLCCTHLMVKGFGNEEILGKGKWIFLNYLECEDPDQYEMHFEIIRRKINRTHDAFSVEADIDREINVTYGLEIVANKEVDGGFKFYQRLTDESFCNWFAKYIGSNFQEILSMANVDPPNCPVPVGKFVIKDYVVNYQQLKKSGLYGTYDTSVYLVYLGEKIACLRGLLRYEKDVGDDDCDDDDDDE